MSIEDTENLLKRAGAAYVVHKTGNTIFVFLIGVTLFWVGLLYVMTLLNVAEPFVEAGMYWEAREMVLNKVIADIWAVVVWLFTGVKNMILFIWENFIPFMKFIFGIR